jgi:hypothetical protein
MGDTRVASPIICKEISAGEPCAIGAGLCEGPRRVEWGERRTRMNTL